MSLAQPVTIWLVRAHISGITDEGLLESFLVVWHYVSMMDSDIQWKVGAWLGTESKVCLVWTISLPGQ